MKRVISLLLVLGLCSVLGCPGGDEPADDGNAGETPAVTEDGGEADSGPRKEFKEGVGSGRAEDGSDEDS
jgi:hypothetical protein